MLSGPSLVVSCGSDRPVSLRSRRTPQLARSRIRSRSLPAGAAGQAVSTAHMAAHALGAAAYAAKAVRLATPDDPAVVTDELRWQRRLTWS